MAAAEQRHIGVHVREDTADGGATRHAGTDEDQEEELTHGKCLLGQTPPTRVSSNSVNSPDTENIFRPYFCRCQCCIWPEYLDRTVWHTYAWSWYIPTYTVSHKK